MRDRNNEVNVVCGYSFSDVTTENYKSIAEIETNGESADGIANSETLGSAEFDDGLPIIYRGSIDEMNACAAIHLSIKTKDLPSILRKLANELDYHLTW